MHPNCDQEGNDCDGAITTICGAPADDDCADTVKDWLLNGFKRSGAGGPAPPPGACVQMVRNCARYCATQPPAKRAACSTDCAGLCGPIG